MKKISIALLQAATVLIGVGALVFLLWEPHLEGRNVGATLFEIYFKDPFLAYAYLSSIPFFIAVWQVFKVLGLVRQDKAFSQASVSALRTIKRCAITLVCLVAGAEAYIFIAMRGTDDIAGGVAMGLFIILVSVAVAIAAGVCEKAVRK